MRSRCLLAHPHLPQVDAVAAPFAGVPGLPIERADHPVRQRAGDVSDRGEAGVMAHLLHPCRARPAALPAEGLVRPSPAAGFGYPMDDTVGGVADGRLEE